MREEPCNKMGSTRNLYVLAEVAYVRDNPATFGHGFAEWLERNPAIWHRFKMEADRVRRRRSHYSASTIVGYLRHETALAEVDGEFKINNNATADMARLYLATTPGASDFFEIREQRMGR